VDVPAERFIVTCWPWFILIFKFVFYLDRWIECYYCLSGRSGVECWSVKDVGVVGMNTRVDYRYGYRRCFVVGINFKRSNCQELFQIIIALLTLACLAVPFICPCHFVQIGPYLMPWSGQKCLSLFRIFPKKVYHITDVWVS
jgi:hypothetical protein